MVLDSFTQDLCMLLVPGAWYLRQDTRCIQLVFGVWNNQDIIHSCTCVYVEYSAYTLELEA